MKVLRYTLFGLLGLVLILVVVAAVFVMTFDPRQYKTEIEALVKKQTGRTLVLSDDMQMSLFPNLGIKVGPTTLTDKDQKTTFISFESAQVSVAVMPLLKKEVLIDGIYLSGLRANLVRDKQGKFNFSDLLEKQPPTDAPKEVEIKGDDGEAASIVFDVGGVELKQATITYLDQATDQRFDIQSLNLKTGQLALQSSGELTLSGHVIAPSLPVDANVDLKGIYKVDVPAAKYALDGLALAVNGHAFHIQNLTFNAKTSIDADLNAVKFDLKNIEVDATSKALFKASLRSAGLAWAQDKFSAKDINLSANMEQPRQKYGLQLQIPEAKGSASNVEIASFTSTIQADMPDVLGTAIKVPVSGNLKADLVKQNAKANIAAKFDDSNITAALELPRFSPAAYRADIKVDQIDLDRYLAKPAAQGDTAAKSESNNKPATPAKDTAIDLSAINGLDLQAKIAIGKLKAYGVALTQVAADIKAQNGQLRFGPHSANLAGGSIKGDININAKNNQFAVVESVSQVALGQLLTDLGYSTRLEGKGNVDINIKTQGKLVSQLKQNLNGDVKLKVTDGAIRGVDIARLLRSIQGIIANGQLPTFSEDDKTVFSELSATVNIKQGVASNNDLNMKAPLFRVQGQGDVNLVTEQVNYLAKLAVVETSQGQGGPELDALKGVTIPVRLVGTLSNIGYQLDIPLIAAEIAKSKVGQDLGKKIEEAVGKDTVEKVEKLLGPDLGNKLKGLFGR